MSEKILLVLCDGTRPAEAEKCYGKYFGKEEFTKCLDGTTVFPSTTLPCHLSLCYSISPEKHHTVDARYVPFSGYANLFEAIKRSGKTCSFYYSWGELKDIYTP